MKWLEWLLDEYIAAANDSPLFVGACMMAILVIGLSMLVILVFVGPALIWNGVGQ